MKAFLAVSAGRRRARVDWLRVIAIWSTVVTIIVIVLYFLQR